MDFRRLARELDSIGHEAGRVAGLSDDQIAEIEARCLHGVKAPVVYVEFMKNMGRCAGPLLAGTDIFYPAIVQYQEELMDFVRRDSSGMLPPDDAFIFASHQGYQVYWMATGGGGDPAVDEYQESDGIVQHWESFTDFIASELSAASSW